MSDDICLIKMDSETLRKYYLSYTNMLNVLIYRGFDSKKINKLALTKEKFFDIYGSCDIQDMKNGMSENMVFEVKNKPTTMIVWLTEPKLGANIADINSQLENSGATSALVIADEGTTPQAKETIRNLRTTKKIFIDVWTLLESMIFVPDHIYVPKHRICSPKEKKAVFTSYGIDNGKKIPLITTTDVMVKFLGANKGDLIEILRPSETDPTKFILTYRTVS